MGNSERDVDNAFEGPREAGSRTSQEASDDTATEVSQHFADRS